MSNGIGKYVSGIMVGVGLYMIVDSTIQLIQLRKGTHETDKAYKRGFEIGKMVGKMDGLIESVEIFDKVCNNAKHKTK